MGHDGAHALHARQRPDDRQSVERDRPQPRMAAQQRDGLCPGQQRDGAGAEHLAGRGPVGRRSLEQRVGVVGVQLQRAAGDGADVDPGGHLDGVQDDAVRSGHGDEAGDLDKPLSRHI